MLCPKRTSYRKYQKGKSKLQQTSKCPDILHFGRYGIKVNSSGYLNSNTISAVKLVITRRLKRQGQIWIRVFPNKVKSEKPLATRMGKGKGSPSYWYVQVHAGQIIFEIDGVSTSLAQQAFYDAEKKLSLSAVFVKN